MQIKGLMMKPICLAILFAFMALRPAQAAPCGPQYSQPCTETDTAATQVEKRQGKWGSNDSEWTTSFRHCSAEKQFSVNGDTTFGENQEVLAREWGATVSLSLEDVLHLQKQLPELKKCTAFWKCVNDREAGKVKHCFENDRRWR